MTHHINDELMFQITKKYYELLLRNWYALRLLVDDVFTIPRRQ